MHMNVVNVEIGTVVAQFLFWESLFGIFGIAPCSVAAADQSGVI
jgi:hypothetical protein